jgi:ribosomal small subunit protein bTHX
MGKGDKKSRRGKIILGSSGVRRPKSKKKAIVKVEAVPAAVVVKNKKVAEAPKTELKPKVKAAEPVAVTETEVADAPQKAVKKAVKKAKVEDVSEKE